MFYAEEKAPLTFEKYLENKEKVSNEIWIRLYLVLHEEHEIFSC